MLSASHRRPSQGLSNARIWVSCKSYDLKNITFDTHGGGGVRFSDLWNCDGSSSHGVHYSKVGCCVLKDGPAKEPCTAAGRRVRVGTGTALAFDRRCRLAVGLFCEPAALTGLASFLFLILYLYACQISNRKWNFHNRMDGSFHHTDCSAGLASFSLPFSAHVLRCPCLWPLMDTGIPILPALLLLSSPGWSSEFLLVRCPGELSQATPPSLCCHLPSSRKLDGCVSLAQ